MQVCVLADDAELLGSWEAWLHHRGCTVVAPPTPRSAPAAQALLLVATSASRCVEVVRDRGWEYGLDLHLVAGKPALAVGAAMAALFETVDHDGSTTEGLAQWPGVASWWPAEGSAVDLWTTGETPTLAGLPWTEGAVSCVAGPLCTTWELVPHGPFTVVTPEVTWADTAPPTVVGVHNGPLRAAAVEASAHGEGGELVAVWLDHLAASTSNPSPRSV